ncbi:MAG: hypothetical protein H7X80_07875, partial [bacterium]|nr:hypothetical protein [Candidatus Kapabacteria bacterium]
GLLDSIPHPVKGDRIPRLKAIRGMVPNILDMPRACKFNSRCDYAMKICMDVEPDLAEIEPGHFVRCHLYPESVPQGHRVPLEAQQQA